MLSSKETKIRNSLPITADSLLKRKKIYKHV